MIEADSGLMSLAKTPERKREEPMAGMQVSTDLGPKSSMVIPQRLI